jgi:hypothetical protein
VSPDLLRQISPGSVFKREVGIATELTHIIDFDDVGMAQAGDGLGLKAETRKFQESRTSGAKDHLESHEAVVIQFPGLVHDPHASPAQFA